jgi:hypothetical protein
LGVDGAPTFPPGPPAAAAAAAAASAAAALRTSATELAIRVAATAPSSTAEEGWVGGRE